MKTLTRREVRGVDQRAIDDFGMSGLVLMENAGRQCAELIHRLAKRGKMVILAGLGNNGGDGFVIARHWELLRAVKPTVLLVAGTGTAPEQRMSGDARTNFGILKKSGFIVHPIETLDSVIMEKIRSADVLVDAMLGTGARPGLVSPTLEVVRTANESNGQRFSIDIPTGLDCDTGEIEDTCFRAQHTLTFVAPKFGFFLGQAPHFIGDVHVIDIGVPKVLLDEVVGC
jgi:NAD(P)H-hydrate epimerase